MEQIKTRVKIFGPATKDDLEGWMNRFFAANQKDRIRVSQVVPLSTDVQAYGAGSKLSERLHVLAVFYEVP